MCNEETRFCLRKRKNSLQLASQIIILIVYLYVCVCVHVINWQTKVGRGLGRVTR